MNDAFARVVREAQKPSSEKVQVRKAIAINQDTLEEIKPVAPLTLLGKLALLRSLYLIYSQAKLTMKKSSWKTTVGGILIAAAPVAHNILPANWGWVSDAFVAIGGLFLTQARDNNVTSEQAGAK